MHGSQGHSQSISLNIQFNLNQISNGYLLSGLRERPSAQSGGTIDNEFSRIGQAGYSSELQSLQVHIAQIQSSSLIQRSYLHTDNELAHRSQDVKQLVRSQQSGGSQHLLHLLPRIGQ